MNEIHGWRRSLRGAPHQIIPWCTAIIGVVMLVALLAASLLPSTPIAQASENAAPASKTLSWTQLKPTLEKYVGAVPYVWGAKDYDAWDCSGFVGRMLVDCYGLPIPGGSWDYCGTYQIADLLADSFVTRGDSIEEFERDVDAQIIRPGDIVLFGVEDRDAVHVGIIGEDASVYHAWTEEKGTVHTTMREIWGVPVGHDKTFTYYRIFRGLTDPQVRVKLQKRSAMSSVTLNNPNYSLAGAVYALYDKNGLEIDRLTCDAEGNTTVSKELALGSYSYQEIEAPEGFLLDNQRHSFELKAQDADSSGVVAIQTEPEYIQTVQNIQIQKVDSEANAPKAPAGATLADAVFEVAYYPLKAHSVTSPEELKGITPLKTWRVTTNEAGYASLDTWEDVEGAQRGLPFGIVSVQEVQAPKGYLLNNQKQLIHLDAQAAEKSDTTPLVAVVDQQIKRGDFRLVKHVRMDGQDAAPLARVPFRITNTHTKETHILYTDENGVLSTNSAHRPHTQHTNEDTPEAGVWFGKGAANDSKGALPYGVYSVEELPCPQNAALILAEVIEVEITDDATEIDLGRIINEEQPYTLVSKTDITGEKELPGAHLSIFDQEGKLVQSWVSGEHAHKVHLKPGRYRLHEESAPAGYVLASDLTFEVTEDLKVTPVTMVDEAIEVVIAKIDASTHKPLEGAHFELIDAQGSVVDTWISSLDDHQIHALPAGTYRLHETAAPDGYLPMDDLTIEVKSTSEVQRFEAENWPYDPQVPHTNDVSWTYALTVCVGAIMGALGIAWRRILYLQ